MRASSWNEVGTDGMTCVRRRTRHARTLPSLHRRVGPKTPEIARFRETNVCSTPDNRRGNQACADLPRERRQWKTGPLRPSVVSAPRQGADDEERFGADRHRVGKRRVRWLERKVFFAGEESDEGAAPMRDVV